jgi:hypothetical protein
MSNTYAIVFKGEILDGADSAAVQQKIGAMFKADAAKLAALFSGKPIAIKKNVDEATANKFIAAFAKAGAKAYVKNMAAPAPAPQQETITAAPTSSGDEVSYNPDADASLREAPQTVVNLQAGSLEGLSMSEPTEFLVDPAPADFTPAPEAIEADLAAEGTTIPPPPKDTTPPPEPGDWGLSDGAGEGESGAKASFSLDP